MSRQLQAVPSTKGRHLNPHRVGHPGRVEWIKAVDLRIDRRYQRGVNAKRVGDLVANWDDDSFGILLVSERDAGYFLIDGQHRREGMMAMGEESLEAPSFVMSDLTVQQEADIFWRINKTRLQPGSADTFKARLVAEEPTALMLAETASDLGVTIMYYPTQLKPNEVYAIAAMERIYHSGDLEWVLGVIREGWKDQPAALRQDRLLGVWRFIQVFRNEFNPVLEVGRARRAHMIARMHEFPPSVIIDKAVEFKTTLHSRPATAFARSLHFYFNYKIKTSPVKLPLWPSSSGHIDD